MKYFFISAFAFLGSVQSAVALEPPKDDKECVSRLTESRELGAQFGQLFASGKYAEALSRQERAVALVESCQIEDVYTAYLLTNRALVRANMGHFDKAEQDYLRAIRIYESQSSQALDEAVGLYMNTGIFYLNTDRTPQAEGYFKKALNVSKSDDEKREISKFLIKIYKKSGRVDEATALNKKYTDK